MMRAYIAKYWDTRGIIEAKVTPCEKMPNAVWDGKPGQVRFRYVAGEWFDTLDEAIAHAELCREQMIAHMAANIESMRRRLARLQSKPPIKVKLLKPGKTRNQGNSNG